MRFFGTVSALVLPVALFVSALSTSACLGGDDTSVAPPPVVDAGPDATTAKDGGTDAATSHADAAPEDAAAPADAASSDADVADAT